MWGQGGGRVLNLANMQKNHKVEGFGEEKGTCVRQWEPSADSHFTGNERRKNKKRLLSKIVTYVFRALYDKV